MRIGSLCSGYGGLTLAVQEVFGGTVAWHSEFEAAPSKVLDVRFPGVRNLGDMTRVDWAAVPGVAVLEGGTPCQDVSHAGARRGMREGTRSGLWASMVDAIDALRPQYVVWENVRGVLSSAADSDLEHCPVCVGDGSGDALRALGRVLGDLADSGYDARWCGLPASAVGAPHPRFRVFVVARDASDVVGEWGGPLHGVGAWDAGQARGTGRHAAQDADEPASRERGIAASGQAEGGWPRADVGGRGRAPVTDSPRVGRPEGWTESAGELGGPDAPERGHAVDADAYSVGLDRVGRIDPEQRHADGRGGQDVTWGPYEPAIRRWENVTGRAAPTPRQPSARGGEHLAPRFVEWMMGLPAGWVTDVPGLTRNDQLKMLGNGVVPQQAAAALRYLIHHDNGGSNE